MTGDRETDNRDYQAIVEQVPAIVYIAEPGADGTWLYVSGWVEPILGYTAEEFMADASWTRTVHPDDLARVLETGRRVIDETPGEVCSLEYRMLHKDGHPVWIRDRTKLITDKHGVHHWYGVLYDITEQKLMEAELERQSSAQAAIAELGERALERIPVEDLLAEACEAVTRVLEVEASLVARASPDQTTLELACSFGWRDAQQRRRIAVDGKTQIGSALLTGRPVVVEDWATETRFVRTSALAERDIRSSIAVRIEGREQPWGCFGVMSTRSRVYTPRDVAFVQSLANVLADAIERQQREDEIEHRSLHDALTGLPNRTLFNDRLEHAFERLHRRGHAIAALLFVDIDNFKQVNDSLGHQAGDELLVSVAQRLREAVRPTDTVARLAGDEFVVLLEEIASERDAIATAERIAAGFTRPFALEAGSQFVTASLGIALADGFMSPAELLEKADTAMYRAKERGRARYEMFDEDMRVRALARGRLESDLLRALDHGEMHLVYQPVVRLSDRSLLGVETLVRWDHPTRGVIEPSEFVPVAEESGLIERLGRWVLDETFHEAAAWGQLRPDQPPLFVGINVSTHQLHTARFADQLSDSISAYKLDPDSVVIEITESALSEDAEAVRDTLRRLSELGVRLGIDNFGTGQSSLRHLSELPLNTIKIDRSFVAKLGTNSPGHEMTRAMLALAAALSLRAVAEGVETPEQAAELLALGCGAAQGYLFSEPLDATGISELLRSGMQLGHF